MNFEKLEVYGFKSFADKVEIKFDNGVTGIVGPNGCGKSNVADAIRWVLGEQSAKNLRGSSMQDVIFSGTQGRKSLSYCEVSLYFDNTNRMFSIDYNEVIITRKLFRSGESEYYINKQPARLKDIVDLLHECGIGKEGYTIIGQGKVEEIMSAKPEDRRLIFEEAAGIAKFKARKAESERKLDRTHDNLTRLLDIMVEIENQLGPLERQSEKAKLFNQLSDDLKHHELNTYIAKSEGVENAKAKVNTRIKGIEEQGALRMDELSAAQKEYDDIFSDIAKADAKLKGYNDELLEKRVAMEKSSGAKKLFEERISYMQGQIARAEKEIGENEKLIEECLSGKAADEKRLVEATDELKKSAVKAEELKSRIIALSEKISLGEELASANRQKVIESIESLSDYKLSSGTMSVERNNLREKYDELGERVDALSVKRDKLFNDKEACDKEIDTLDRGVFELKNKIQNTEELVKGKNEDTATLDNKIFTLNSNISVLAARDAFYKENKERYEGFISSVKLLLNDANKNGALKSRIKGVVAKLIKSDKKYDVALETALGMAAQNVVTETLDDAKYLIEYLKQNKYGRVTFLPVNSVKPRERNESVTYALKEIGALGVADEIVSFEPQYKNVISNLLGNTMIVDTLDNATKMANKYRSAFKIVTLDGDVFSTQGAVTGGSRKADTVGLLSGDRKMEENAALLAAKRDEMEKIKTQKAAEEQERDKALDELSMLNEMYNGKRQQVVLEREKQAALENSLIEIGKEIEAVSDLRDGLKERLNEMDLEFEKVASGGKELEEVREKAGSAAEKQQAEYDELRRQRDALSTESTDLQVKIASLKGEIEGLKEDSERLTAAINDAKSGNEKLKENNVSAAEIIENLRRDEEKVILSKEEQDYINGIRDKIEEIENYKVNLKEKLEANDEKKKSIAEQINALTEKKHAEEIALAKIDSDLDYLQQTVWKDYQETYETALKYKAENYDVSFGEQEILRLRKKRASLGAINATAIEEFKLQKERYDEMSAQKDDLEKAESDLRLTIDKLKGEMITQFDGAFKKINENFQKIFKELFGGGRAMLQLDYADGVDKLDAGIEIVAEPPGKKLQKLSLLSGGEKALTAIAILFSILKMRPMPFCVLDEIEAALDEANVDRFARYMRKFSDDTQFIVITHKKPTMELADALFGVTMQEKGVSKIVSVKLSDAVAFDQLA